MLSTSRDITVYPLLFHVVRNWMEVTRLARYANRLRIPIVSHLLPDRVEQPVDLEAATEEGN